MKRGRILWYKSGIFISARQRLTDEHVFIRLFTGVQGSIDSLINAIRTTVYNDPVNNKGMLDTGLPIYNQ